MATRVLGLDCNEYVVDWQAARVDFALIKATEGTDWQNPEFRANWDAAKAAGLVRFAYHYAHPELPPSRQARWFSDYVNQHSQKGDAYHFVLDLEVNGGLSPVEVSFWARTFCHEMNAYNPGRRIIVYTFPYFAEQGNCATLGNWALWIADYGVERPMVPLPWRRWAFWQYASGTNVDYDEWNGTIEQLREYVAHSG